MRRTLLSLLIALTCSAVQAADDAPTKASRRQEAAARAAAQEDLLGRTVFQVLVGEIALQRGQIDLGLSSYTDLARRTHDPKVLARAAEIASFARQYDLALDLTRQWSQAEPDSQKARQFQSTLLILLNRTDDLAPQIGALLEQDKDNLAANLLGLNRMLIRQTDKQAVLRLIDRVTAPYLQLAEAHYARATAAVAANDSSRALSEAEQAVRIRPEWESAILLQAQLTSRQSPSQAINQLNRYLSSNPEAKEARLVLARLLITDKRYDEARTHFDRLIRDFPEHPDVLYPVAMLALQQGDTKTGKQHLEKLLNSDFPDKSTLRFFLGQIEEELQQPEAALAHYREVSSGDQLVPARARSAQLLVSLGRLEEARKLIHDTPGRSAAERIQLLLAESQLLRESKRYEEAYSLLDGALRKQPDSTELLYDAALIAERLGKMDVLERNLKRLLEIKPDHAHGLNALGFSLADRNIRLNEAEQLISKALSLAPDDPFIMDSLGWVLFRQGRREDAALTLQKAYALKADPEIAAHLGEVLWSLNRKEEARRVLDEAFRKHPDNEVLVATLKKTQP